MKLKKFSDSKSIIMSKENVKTVAGSEHMLSLGGGVRAKIGKTKEGEPVIREFLFDRNRFSDEQAEAWIKDNQAYIETSLKQVQENAPKGSFTDIAARVSASLIASDILPRDSDGHRPWYIDWIFPDYVIVSAGGEYLKITYSEASDGSFNFGNPEQVDMEFVSKESGNLLKEIDKRTAPNCDLAESGIYSIEEADKDKRQVLAVLIEAGSNFAKKRHYPERTLKEAAGLFSGLKMYIDHPTEKEEIEKPERSLREWVATIVESWYDEGRVMGRVQIHADWLWESLSTDEVFRNHIGISINAAGRRSFATIDGQTMEVIEEIVAPRSVDWVTEPGARGRVLALIESAKIKKEQEGDLNMLKTVKLEELKSERPDLVKAILDESNASGKVSEKDAEIQRLTEENKQLKKDSEDRAKADRKAAHAAKIKETIDATKLPAASKEVLIERHSAQDFESEEALVKCLDESIKAELAYLTKLGGVKIDSQEGEHGTTSISEGLEKRLGIAGEKK